MYDAFGATRQQQGFPVVEPRRNIGIGRTDETQGVDGLETKVDKILAIIKSMSSLGLVLLVLMSTTVASAEGDLYWVTCSPFCPHL